MLFYFLAGKHKIESITLQGSVKFRNSIRRRKESGRTERRNREECALVNEVAVSNSSLVTLARRRAADRCAFSAIDRAFGEKVSPLM